MLTHSSVDNLLGDITNISNIRESCVGNVLSYFTALRMYGVDSGSIWYMWLGADRKLHNNYAKEDGLYVYDEVYTLIKYEYKVIESSHPMQCFYISDVA